MDTNTSSFQDGFAVGNGHVPIAMFDYQTVLLTDYHYVPSL